MRSDQEPKERRMELVLGREGDRSGRSAEGGASRRREEWLMRRRRARTGGLASELLKLRTTESDSTPATLYRTGKKTEKSEQEARLSAEYPVYVTRHPYYAQDPSFDPASQACPDFTSDEFAEDQEEFMAEGMTHDTAATLLARARRVNMRKEADKWRKANEDAAAVEEERARIFAEEEATRATLEAFGQEEALRADKKKYPHKYSPINMRDPPNQRPDIPGTYALKRLEEGVSLELYYLGREGLDAAKNTAVSGDDPKTPFSQSSGLRFYTHQQAFGVREPLVQAPGLHFNTGRQDPGVRDPYSRMSHTHSLWYR
ncbi:hypothetical protein M422DRAFT_254890, partial [Sphaerobolus stellatus SS14]